MITQEKLKELLDYDPNTGIFTWNVSRGKGKIGSAAGTKTRYGYTRIMVEGKLYFTHRLAWLYMTGNWPSEHIDHIDRDSSNNKFDNLREVTHAENRQNTRSKGYYWDKNRNLWRAQIKLNGKYKYYGYHQTEEEARQAYLNAKNKYHPFYSE
jgi:hypothetical protein